MSEERYDILKLLGKGRTGGVYEAEDTRLGRKVAMRRFFSQNEQMDISDYAEEFKRTWQDLSNLQHPNLLRVFDAGADEDGAFIISQLMKGDSLHNRLKEGALSDWDTWDLGHQMLDALSTAHAGGFVHGAITPGSIIMSPRARGGYLYVILDMGLSRLAPLIQGKDSVLSMMADPAILAPELFDNSEATEKSDLYMLGNILYMCLAGGHPFAGKSIDECAELHRGGLPSLVEFAPHTPQDFLDWIAELYHVDAALRPESVVVALRSMPKVQKPTKVSVSAINTSVGMVTQQISAPVTTVPPASTYGANAEVAAAGRLAAGGGVLAQTTEGQLLNKYQASAKSYKALMITAVTIILLGVGLYFMMSGSSKKTGEEIAAEKARKENLNREKEESVSDEDVAATDGSVALERRMYLGLKNGVVNTDGWIRYHKTKQRSTNVGWEISGSKGNNPGISRVLGSSDIEDMYRGGWSIKYEVKALYTKHTVGMLISSDENDYWRSAGKPVGILLRLEKVGSKLIIMDLASRKRKEFKDGDRFFVIELRGKAGDSSGSYQLFVDGNMVEGFSGKLSQARIRAVDYANRLFSFSGDKSQGENKWVFKELSLSIGTSN